MGQETFYFSHDYNPSGDAKMFMLLNKYGAVGYGVYWRIVEMLHSEESHKLPLKKYIFTSLSQQLKVSVDDLMDMVDYAIKECELFIYDNEEYFYSERVNRNIAKRKEEHEKKSKAGKESAKVRKEQADLLEQLKAFTQSNDVQQVLNGVQQCSTKERKRK
jgi:hypothetical protein